MPIPSRSTAPAPTLAELDVIADSLIASGTSCTSPAAPSDIVSALIRTVFDYVNAEAYVPTLFL
jgi:hypothetical protein